MKKILISLMAVVLMVAFMPVGVFAADKTVKSKMYEIYVTGNYVYVVGNKGIYSVKMKNEKPVSKEKIAKCGSKYAIDRLKVKGKYVYFTKSNSSADKTILYRVKKTGGKVKKLVTMGEVANVAFKGKKIYYTYCGPETDENGMYINTYKKVMKLNGKDKKNTDIEAVEDDVYRNNKGYKYTFKEKDGDIIVYLKTPKGKIKLEKL